MKIFDKDIKIILSFFVLITFCLSSNAQTDSIKKRSLGIAINVKSEHSFDPVIASASENTTKVYGTGGDVIIHGHKKTDIIIGLGYREKGFQDVAEDTTRWHRGYIGHVLYQFLELSLDFRKNGKLIYWGSGIIGETLLGRSEDFITPPDVFLLGTDTKINIGINGFVGIKKTIENKLDLFVQFEFTQDLLPISTYYTTNHLATAGFLNYGISIGIEYNLNKSI